MAGFQGYVSLITWHCLLFYLNCHTWGREEKLLSLTSDSTWPWVPSGGQTRKHVETWRRGGSSSCNSREWSRARSGRASAYQPCHVSLMDPVAGFLLAGRQEADPGESQNEERTGALP